MFRNKLDLKVFLDVDGDLRVANMRKLNFFHDTGLVEHWNSNLTREKVSSHNFHCDVVMKQRKYADIWLEEITPGDSYTNDQFLSRETKVGRRPDLELSSSEGK